MSIIVPQDAHFFIPESEAKLFEYKAPIIPEIGPEFRSASVPQIISSYTFSGTHYPKRVCDIFLYNPDTKFYYPNRIISQQVGGTVVHGYSTFNYDVSTKTIHVNSNLIPEDGNIRIDWIDISKFPNREHWKNWTALNIFPYQENDIYSPQNFRTHRHIEIDFINNKYVFDEGSYRWQGHDDNSYTPSLKARNGSRCYIEICSKPVFGQIAFNDTMDGLMYRGSKLNPVGFDTFQFKLYNQYHSESDAHCIKIRLR